MQSSSSSTASVVRSMDALLNAKCGSAFDWAAVVALCDTLNACSKRDAEAAVHILCVRLDAAQRARTKNMTGPGASAAEERTVRALMLLDSLVKNVGSARSVAASKNTLALLEKIADLQQKTASARSARSKQKVREQSRGTVVGFARSSFTRLDDKEEEESMSILGPSVDDDDDSSAGNGAGSSKKVTDEGRPDIGGAEDWAMRILQAWGMLHPAEFPLYLKAMEKWKKAGVVFPPPSPEDLLPLPKISKSTTAAKQAPAQPAAKDPDAEAKRVMTEVIQQLSTVACDTAALLGEMCSASNASSAEGEDEELDTAELRATLVTQCKDMRTAMTAVVEAALSGKSLPPLRPGGPRVLVYKSGADEAAREAAVAFLFGVVERLDNAIAMNDDCTKQQARIKEERKRAQQQPLQHQQAAKPSESKLPSMPALVPTVSLPSPSPEVTTTAPPSQSSSSSTNSDVFNPFNLPESVIIPQSPTAASAATTAAAAAPSLPSAATTTTAAAAAATSTAPVAQTTASSTSYLDELLGTAPVSTPTQSSTTPKRDALTDLLFS